MEKSLHITDKQFLLVLTIFFFPYALFEVTCFRVPSEL
jgi:hypothetical protein